MNIKVLIVDDDPVFSLFVVQLLTALGDDFPSVTECADTPEKALAELNRDTYDLVLLDYHLPRADGLQVLAQIRQLPANRQPAVIMLTASGNEAVAVEAMKRGASDYVPKSSLDVAPLLRVLRNALLQKQLAEQLAQQEAQKRADLEMARRFQQSLLPDSYPVFPLSASPADSTLRFCHRFSPASELAGDFFHVLRVSDTQAGVFICDVMGHGVRSALVTAIVRSLIGDAAPRAADPCRFLARMNQRLAGLLKSTDNPLFATAFYLLADAAKGRIRYANAGHPAPVHLKARQRVATTLSIPHAAGPALGLFRDASYPGAECPFEPGDVVLLFTDGLIEVINGDGQEEYGRDRLQAAAQRHMQLPPDALCEALLAEARGFAGGAPLADDVCMVTVQSAGK